MWDQIQSLNDDQLAILGCVAALAISGFALYVSLYIGQAVRKPHRAESQILPLHHRAAEERSHERAA